MNSENMNCILTYAKDPNYKEPKLSTLDQILKNGSGLPTKEDKPETSADISERLKISLEELQFPIEYNDQKVTGGHPSYFSKILKHVLFGFDKRIPDHLLQKGVDTQ